MLDIGTGTGKVVLRRAAKRPSKTKAKRAKSETYSLAMLYAPDDTEYSRVFIAVGEARQVAKQLREANKWHCADMQVTAKSRLDRRECMVVKRLIHSARIRGHWYSAQSETVDRLLAAYNVHDIEDRDAAKAWFAACVRN